MESLNISNWKTEVLFTIRGDGFDSKSFQKSLPIERRGEIKTLKNWNREMPKNRKYFWCTPRRYVLEGGSMHNTLQELLEQYGSSFALFVEAKNVDITCNVVTHYNGPSSVHGFWFPPKLIFLLAKFGAGVDIDTYCEEQETKVCGTVSENDQ